MLTLRKDALLLARKGRELSQAALAKKAGVARITVNRIEKDHPDSVTFDTINRLAKALGVDTDTLVTFK